MRLVISSQLFKLNHNFLIWKKKKKKRSSFLSQRVGLKIGHGDAGDEDTGDKVIEEGGGGGGGGRRMVMVMEVVMCVFEAT